MADSFSFQIDTRQLDQKLGEIGRRAPVIVAQTLNRTANKVRTFMKREIGRDIGIPVGVVDKQMSIRNASPGEPRAVLALKNKRIPLIDLGAQGPEPSRGKGRGVGFRGRTKRRPHAFIATMPGGHHRGVFEREPWSRHKKRPPRHDLPIRELFTPSLGTFFRKHIGKARALAQEGVVSELRRRLFSKGAI